jgi:hypothetical protein
MGEKKGGKKKGRKKNKIKRNNKRMREVTQNTSPPVSRVKRTIVKMRRRKGYSIICNSSK